MGLRVGDDVTVSVETDDTPRVVDVPPESSEEKQAAPPSAETQAPAPKPPASVAPGPMAGPPAVLFIDPDEAEGGDAGEGDN